MGDQQGTDKQGLGGQALERNRNQRRGEETEGLRHSKPVPSKHIFKIKKLVLTEEGHHVNDTVTQTIPQKRNHSQAQRF